MVTFVMPKTSVTNTRNVSKTVKMSEGHAQRLERVCERLDISINSYLVQALSRALIADEGRIAQADMADNMRQDIQAMFAPLIAGLQADEGESKHDD
jgi:hypothetical protein